MKYCAQCGGKFGLIRQRWHGYQFCSKKCRATFLENFSREKELVRAWLEAQKR
jgi:endogenous inhibitor of DNA gyrase (YacG/DUF329 family)